MTTITRRTMRRRARTTATIIPAIKPMLLSGPGTTSGAGGREVEINNDVRVM